MLERALPGREVLAQRLFAQSQELADARRHLQRYHALVVALQQELDALAGAAPGGRWRELQSPARARASPTCSPPTPRTR